jgi:hypothetical protein
VVLLGAALLAALPAPAHAALSQAYAALFDNANGAGPKMVTTVDVRAYATGRLKGAEQTLITGLIDRNGFTHPEQIIQVRLAAGMAVTPNDSISTIVASSNVKIQAALGNTSWVALPAGDNRRDAFVSILKAINLIEQNAPIINPQIERPRDGKYQNFSIDFIQKHAAKNDDEAIAVARDRFQRRGNFQGQPVPPVSQNLDAGPFGDFVAYVNQMAAANVFTSAEAQALAMRDTVVGQLQSIDSVQYITAGQYQVRTYNPGGTGGATRGPVAQQHVQFAFTHSTQRPATLIVNHMITPIVNGNNQPAPAPAAGPGEAWHQLMPNNNRTQNRPAIFYMTGPLERRGDL